MARFIEIIKKYGHHFKNPVTLVDLTLPDQPLIYVNNKFTDCTQFTEEEILGKNCRFLQGPETNKATADIIRESIKSRNFLCEDILNYRKDGSKFYNRLVLLPYKSFYIGLQNEITFEKYQIFNNRHDLIIRDKGLNALTVLYLAVISSEDNEIAALRKLETVFDRIHNLVINL